VAQPDLPSSPGGGDGGDGPKPNAMKGRAIENWLNHALGQSNAKPGSEGAVASTTAKQMQGLSQFGIDAAALEKLGLDAKSAERVYRAMFVYSQGLHAVLQEAVGKAKSAPQALLVLWRAFTAVLEHAGQSEQAGADSLAALVQRGNEEEKERIEGLYRDKLDHIQAQSQKLAMERRTMQEEVTRLREDENRLRNESDMFRNEHEVAMQKYEKEIKLRVDAEVRYLDKTRWAESLGEQLEKEQKQNATLTFQLREETMAKEAAQMELESLKTQLKVLEAQAAAYKQSVMEAAQQKQRHEQQVGQLKQQIDRMSSKISELKEQLEQEADTNKRLTEQNSNQQREMRKLERQVEDESHMRRELQNERDLLRDKHERLDKELAEQAEQQRAMQKQLNDLSMEHRTNQIDLKRKTETLDRTEAQLKKLQQTHRELLDSHRVLSVEAENLREDVKHLEAQVSKESSLRKELQKEKKLMTGQLQTLQFQLEASQQAVTATQKELVEATETKVKLESVVRDIKSSMQKVNLQHQVELKSHVQKVAMLEKIIADERNERRNLVSETQEVFARREEAHERLKRRELECQDLKRQRLEKEEEVDRFKVLLKAQEQRNSEQLVTVDKYHAAVASHEAETRQMQVLLECEREEAKRQLDELQDAYAAARCTLLQRIEHWKFAYEDVLSQLNFNPLTLQIQVLEKEHAEKEAEVKEARETIAAAKERSQSREEELEKRMVQIREFTEVIEEVKRERDEYGKRFASAVLDYERQAFARNDAEQSCERIRRNTEAFDQMKASLEAQVAEALRRNQVLSALLNKPMADAETQVEVHTRCCGGQTDLSYQYLESSNNLLGDKGRRERLDVLRKASRFVEDAEERRDFTVRMRSSAMPVGQAGAETPEEVRNERLRNVDIVFGQEGSAAWVEAAAEGGGQALAAPGPSPLVARPPGQPQDVQQQRAAAMRNSQLQTGPGPEFAPAPPRGGLLHVTKGGAGNQGHRKVSAQRPAGSLR